MLCNNLIDKMNYVDFKQKEHPESETQRLMLEYCETKCNLEYCEKYNLDYKLLHYKFVNQNTKP